MEVSETPALKSLQSSRHAVTLSVNFRIKRQKIPAKFPICGNFVGNFQARELISADLHYHQFRIVVDPHGQDAVAEASGDDQLHAVDVIASFIHLGEDLVFG